jgi:hypothetical protein
VNPVQARRFVQRFSSPALQRAQSPHGVVMDDDARALVDRAGRIGRDDAAADLVTGHVRKGELVAVRHVAARRLDVAEAHAAGQHLEKGVPRRQLGFGEIELLERPRIRCDRHRPHVTIPSISSAPIEVTGPYSIAAWS